MKLAKAGVVTALPFHGCQQRSTAQLVGVDALGLVSMVVQVALPLAARRHRDMCQPLAQHVDIIGGLLRELEVAEMMGGRHGVLAA
ncbi:hypothetical protein C2845_PMPSC055733 [Panicum miliaceum]|nr:hypothetical protein C2845_PMPSC055733 [Panicum miliaceum]